MLKHCLLERIHMHLRSIGFERTAGNPRDRVVCWVQTKDRLDPHHSRVEFRLAPTANGDINVSLRVYTVVGEIGSIEALERFGKRQISALEQRAAEFDHLVSTEKAHTIAVIDAITGDHHSVSYTH